MFAAAVVTVAPVLISLPLIVNVPSLSVGFVAVPLIVGCDEAHDASLVADEAEPTAHHDAPTAAGDQTASIVPYGTRGIDRANFGGKPGSGRRDGHR